METLAAISLAGNIVQFIDFTRSLVSKGHKIYKAADGSLVENAELESATRKIIALNNRVVETYDESRRDAQWTSDVDYELKQLCDSCNKVATQLLYALEKLKLKGRHGRWQSFRQALKTLWKKHDVDLLASRLDSYRRTLDTTLLVSLRQKIDTVTLTQDTRADLASQRKKMSDIIFSRIDKRKRWQATLVDNISEGDWFAEDEKNLAIFSSRFSNITAQERERQLTAQLLHQLRFRDLMDRRDRIAEAHIRTFHWIFEDSDEQQGVPWCSLIKWLQSDGDIYWITGKPGSGKSTLVKYIYHDPRTRHYLLAWAGQLTLVTACFYFWNSGSDIQMSELGLLRSILYEALRQYPSLTPALFPRRWGISSLCGEDTQPWTLSELIQAFNTLLKKSQDVPFKLFLFVDGLDEYSGNYGELIELFRKAISYKNVKVCLSSRPWIVFEDAFSTSPNLMLQYLTYPDILRFVTEKFSTNAGFQVLKKSEPEYALTLIENIAKKSSGVFLWVGLVVNSLLAGLSNCDRISDLQRRLEDIPGDIEELYHKMFNSIDPFYAEHAAQLFQIAREARRMLPVLAFSFADEEEPTLAVSTAVGPLTEDKRMARYEVIKRRLNSRCKGFLEIPSAGSMADTDSSASETSEDPEIEDIIEDIIEDLKKTELNRSRKRRGYASDVSPADLKVAYLHRTARDFLESHGIRERLLASTNRSFRPSVSLLRSSVLILKTLPTNALTRRRIWESIHQCMKYGAAAETRTHEAQIELLDEVDRTAKKLFAASIDSTVSSDRHWTTTRATKRGEHGFLALAAEYELRLYIRAKIERGLNVFTGDSERPLLDYMIVDYKTYPSLCEMDSSTGNEPVPSLSLITRLLERGADPNESYKGMTVWRRALSTALEISRYIVDSDDPHLPVLKHWADIMETFIRHESDPRINRDSPLGSLIREIFGQSVPQRARELEKLLRRSSRRRSKLGKFLVPPLKSKGPPTSEDITPLPKLNALRSVTMPTVTLTERYRGIPGPSEEQTRQNSHMCGHPLSELHPKSVLPKLWGTEWGPTQQSNEYRGLIEAGYLSDYIPSISEQIADEDSSQEGDNYNGSVTHTTPTSPRDGATVFSSESRRREQRLSDLESELITRQLSRDLGQTEHPKEANNRR